LMARRLGLQANEVELLPFGGVTRMGSELVREPGREMLVAAAGPASNLALTMLGVAAKNYGFWHHELGPFFLQCNLLIAAFNILPALPLDGGRVYRAFLARRLGVARATRRAARAGQWWGALVGLSGLAGLLLRYNGLDIPVTGLFLFYAATRELTAAPYVYLLQLESKREQVPRGRTGRHGVAEAGERIARVRQKHRPKNDRQGPSPARPGQLKCARRCGSVSARPAPLDPHGHPVPGGDRRGNLLPAALPHLGRPPRGGRTPRS
ncbi:MAG: M50 family metallopeptidase, partial [Anaerolineae bacterium]|nr:M50 family metallopeptidase [Anaerolineae bacterium]